MTFRQIFPNPYDPNSQDYQPETLPLDEIIRQAIQAAMIKMRVCLPASIKTVKGNQLVDVQPLLQSRYTNGTVITIPVIQNVMVSMPMGQNYSIKLPLAVGDTGWLVFCDRSLDVWIASNGEVVDPQDSRMHDISDPVFIPGLVPIANQTKDTTTDLVLTNGKAILRWLAAGKFKIANDTTTLNTLLQTLCSNIEDLVGNVKDLVTATAAITVTTPIVVPSTPFSGTATSMVPDNASAINAVTSELTSTNNELMDTANKIAGLLV